MKEELYISYLGSYASFTKQILLKREPLTEIEAWKPNMQRITFPIELDSYLDISLVLLPDVCRFSVISFYGNEVWNNTDRSRWSYNIIVTS